MYACPICGAPSISFFRKWLSYPTLPACCPACKSHSHAHRSSGGVGVVVAALLITVFGVVASALQSGRPLLFGIAVKSDYAPTPLVKRGPTTASAYLKRQISMEASWIQHA